MKRIYWLFFTAMLFAFFSLTSFAVDSASQTVTLKGADGNVVESYEIISGNDRTIDSRPAIQKALNTAKSLATKNNKMTVTVPKGEYYISSTLSVYSYCTLDLSNSTIKRTGSDFTMIRVGTIRDDKGGYDGYDSITVKNAVLDGEFSKEKVGDEKAALMKFTHGQNITVDNVAMQNTYGVHHQLTFAAVKNVKITNCSFMNMDVSSITEDFATMNCEAIQLDLLNENCFPNSAPYDGTTSENIEITGCAFKNVPRGCGTHSSMVGNYIYNVKINNNYFENIVGYAIRTTNYRNSEINNNVIVNCGSGIAVSDITGSKLSNVYLTDSGTAVLSPQANITIKGNNISLHDTDYIKSYQYGIDIYGAVIESGDFLKDSDPSQTLKFSGDFRMRAIDIENNSISSTVSKNSFVAININGACGSSNSTNSDFKVLSNTFSFNGALNDDNSVYSIRIR